MWASSSSTGGTSYGYCPCCGQTLSNDACRTVITVSLPSDSIEDGEDPDRHRPLNGDNLRSAIDAPRRTPSPRWCRLRPEVRAPPANPFAVISVRT